MEIEKQRILTGLKPTELPHIGNYIGAIKPAIKLTQRANESFLFIADYHALNSVKDAKLLKEYVYQVAAAWLALGVDTDKVVFYKQSDIPEIFEINTILSAVTPKGLINRSHAYKAAIDKNKKLGKSDLDIGINMGLYTYPILMAADILVQKSTLIPVGKDQIQHVEITRDIAARFNHTFGDIFLLPEAYTSKETELLPGIDGQKMSKSYNNHIPLFMPSKKRRKLIMKIKTDSKTPDEPKDADNCLIYKIYKHFACKNDIEEMYLGFKNGGLGYGDAKQILFEAIEKELSSSTEKYEYLINNKQQIDNILQLGAKKARSVAQKTLKEVKQAIGVNYKN